MKFYSDWAIASRPYEGNIWKNIYENNNDFFSDVALLYYGKKITYKKLFYYVDCTARAFAKQGVRKGDIVILCMPAIPETIYSILALNKLGVTANLLNPLFKEQQLIDRIRETEAKMLVVANEVFSMISGALPRTQIETVISCSAVNSFGGMVKALKGGKTIPGTICWIDFIKMGKNTTYCEAEYLPESAAIVVYSSGTTGASKGIQLTNSSVNSTICEGGSIDFEWKRQDRWLASIPIWFSTGICASILVPLAHGITVILEPDYNFELFYKHIVKYKPNHSISATGLYIYLEQKHYYCDAYRHFKYFVCGGEYITPSTEKQWNKWLSDNGVKHGVHKGYGMCECGGTVTATAYHCNITGAAGIPTPHIVVATFDIKTNEELTYGVRGEIRVLSNCHMKGYFKNPEATADYFYEDKDGSVWCCTGDMGYVTDDGSVFVNGRISDSYIKNNEIIYLFDIERAVMSVEGVKQCKALAYEYERETTHICHIVVDAEKDINAILGEVSDYCKLQLSSSYNPRLFKRWEVQLPVSLSGKLDIQRMKENTDDIIRI